MNRLTILALIYLLVAASCSKDSQTPEFDPADQSQQLIGKTPSEQITFDQIEMISSKIEEVKEMRGSRYQRSNCTETVFVPDDYPTIQEAIFAVCENGNVFVRSGVYQESPGIDTDGIFIKAIGEVTLKGGFGMGANNVSIHGFSIDNSFSEFSRVGIACGPGFNGFDLKHNTIYSSGTSPVGYPFGHIGIYLEYSDDNRIVQNDISGNMEVGIYIDAIRLDFPGSSGHPFGGSTNNVISNNTITGIFGNLDVFYAGTGIQLRGDTDNTTVNGNTVNSSNGWGISLWSFANLGKECDHNTVKNNAVEDHSSNGIEVYFGGSDNTIGPNNESNANGQAGIVLYDYSADNHVFNNTALNNGFCDLVNLGTNNTFKKNTTDCDLGVD